MKTHTILNSIHVDEVKEEALAKAAKAFSHPARIRILRVLLKHTGCLSSDFVNELGLAQSTVSEHLRILKQAGFVIAEPKPPRVCFSLNYQAIEEFSHLLDYIKPSDSSTAE